ncbi:MAG: sodium-dependent transporter [Clostridia bacterium]|nr:sodium-dependent transporter [Clostridia bacterium]
MEKREKFSSRLGFILISAGCAVGLGNVWRFPYIVGKYGGAIFVLIYLVFLAMLAMPILVMEFAVGRASMKSSTKSFLELEPKGTKWHIHGYVSVAGNYLLLMFYTTVGGWMMAYVFKALSGGLEGLTVGQSEIIFEEMLSRPVYMTVWMLVISLLSFGVCSLGLQKGVERITKVMMGSLFVIIGVLCVRSVTLPNAAEGLSFYLVPNVEHIREQGLANVVFAAMSQAFFTLSIGMGSMSIFGSYIDKERSLTGETISISVLDLMVALLAGMIIFPACSAFGVDPGEGPGLVFITLPNIFNKMPFGRLWETLFFVFMTFAAMSTIIAVFENIICMMCDMLGWSRKKSVIINGIALLVLSVPCVLGFNVWSGVQPLGDGSTIQDLEDFIVSYNILPLGSLVYLLFCTTRYGWGWDNFIAEADSGKGIKFPKKLRFYCTYVLPIVIFVVFIIGYKQKFF